MHSPAIKLSNTRAFPVSSTFGTWTAGAAVVLLAVGTTTLALKGVPAADITAASAWGYMGATLATVLGLVCAVACASSGMNDH